MIMIIIIIKRWLSQTKQELCSIWQVLFNSWCIFAANINSGSDGANGGIPGAGIYEANEVIIMMMMIMMIIIIIITAR